MSETNSNLPAGNEWVRYGDIKLLTACPACQQGLSRYWVAAAVIRHSGGRVAAVATP